ncbi:DUF4833 domain-containing protein [Prolixibacteraceae bacterium JC049]|nr:DUF4833 domain-containing protein [Prolixibacteraceae bacterium JC049]
MVMSILMSILICLNLGSFTTQTPKVLFHIERNLNKNIVVYEANFDSQGNLDKKHPIKVYWILKEKNNKQESLNYMERKMAYGIKCTPKKEENNTYKVRLVADDSRQFTLKQLAPYKAAIYTYINKKKCQLKQMFIQADNKAFLPKVKFIELKGINNTIKDELERYFPKK